MSNIAYDLGFASIGADVAVWERAQILSPGDIAIGDSVIIDDFVFLQGSPGCRIGSFVHIGAHAGIAGGGEFVMEDFSGLSGGVRIYTGNEDYSGGCLTNPAVPAPWRQAERSYVRIGKHAIVGACAVILPGVEIGEGAVVGAQALVTKDCKPWSINVGSPARAVRERPRDRILELERDLRATLYDAGGRYIPAAERAP